MFEGKYYSPKGVIHGPIIPRFVLEHPRLTLAAKVVFALLVNCSKPGGTVRPRQTTLCRKSGISRSAVQRALVQLEEEGFIEIQNPTGMDRWAHRTNVYKFTTRAINEYNKQCLEAPEEVTPTEASKRSIQRNVKKTPRYSKYSPSFHKSNKPTRHEDATGPREPEIVLNEAHATSSNGDGSDNDLEPTEDCRPLAILARRFLDELEIGILHRKFSTAAQKRKVAQGHVALRNLNRLDGVDKNQIIAIGNWYVDEFSKHYGQNDFFPEAFSGVSFRKKWKDENKIERAYQKFGPKNGTPTKRNGHSDNPNVLRYDE